MKEINRKIYKLFISYNNNMVKKCEHLKTYKLFYMQCKPTKAWKKTDYHICQNCGDIVMKITKKIEKLK